MNVHLISTNGKPKDKRFKSYSILAADDAVWDYLFSKGEPFGGAPWPTKWKRQTFYLEKPLIPKPDFFGICSSAFICNEKAREIAGGAMEMSGELLPIRVDGERGKYWLYNITNTINVVDEKKSKWDKLGLAPEDRALRRPAFIASRFGEETIFKVAQDRGAGMYCAEFSGDPDEGEFKAVVEHHGLTGLSFEKIWTDNK